MKGGSTALREKCGRMNGRYCSSRMQDIITVHKYIRYYIVYNYVE